MRTLIMAVLLCFSYLIIHATDKVQCSSAPEWLHPVKPDFNKKPTTKNISNGYYLELYDQQVNLITNTRYIHSIKNIVNETGVQNASEVSVTFSPQYQEVVFHTVSLIRNGKVISKLKPGQIRVVDEESEASDFLYYGHKRAFVIIKDVQKNDRLEFAYSIIGFNPVFKNRYSDKIYFSSSTAMCNYFETIIVPDTRKLNFRSFNGAPEPTIETKANVRVYHWSNPTTRIWESQSGTPAWYNEHPYQAITEYNSWQEVINWGNELFNNYRHVLPAALQNKITTWKKLAKGDKDQFAIFAIRYVQDEIRYLGMEMGENTYKPHPPAEVFQHSYGDCKDKSLLLSMILQTENIPAYVAMLNTTKKEKLKEGAPSPEEFDHAIVAIKRSSGYIYIDPTITHQRGELINLYIPPYRYALVIHEGETGLQPIEPDHFNVTHINERLDVKYLDSSRLNVTTLYQGGKADDMRSSLSGLSITELEEYCIQYYDKTFDDIQQADSIIIKDDSSKNSMTVEESYSIPLLWSLNADGKEVFEVFAKPIYQEMPDPAYISKNAPMELNFPSTTYYTLTMVMPDRWDFPKKGLHIKNNSFQFDYVPQVSGNIITLKYTFKTLKDHVPAEEMAQYKASYKMIVDKLSFELSRNNPSATSGNPFGSSLNWIMVWISFGVMLVLSLLFRHLNKPRMSSSENERAGWPIGSWLVFLGISLAASCIFHIVDVFKNNFFDRDVWMILGDDGGVALQSVCVMELSLDLIWVSGGAACFYWFLRRRDIFPRMFIGYVASIIVGEFILLILYSYVPLPSSYGNLATMMGAELFRACLYGMVWITYILRSERAKNTFVNNA